ncbi:RagB/SusD family nutrient uptake outer membrane protein [Terrimonas alba]|uniref:RagB/SusD family nutrient uptake outer membrane protein n=1 Tax=Terrimonas alba TaxID=3349636 RepID=UPI0035F37875
MKNIFHVTIIASFVAVMTTSCEKKLDIDPTQSIDENEALLTSSDVEAALVGAYSDLGDADVYGGSLFVRSELLGNSSATINWSGTFQTMTQIYNKQIPVDNSDVTDTWTDAYQTINDINNVLGAVDIVLPNKKDRVEGEAKFIRGSLYFDLVRLYAKAWNDGNPANNDGVPLVLEPTRAPLGEEDKKPRAKVAEVYAQVIKDLTEAEALLPASNGFFASKYAAAAMLSRVYLQKGDYANAAAAASRVIESNQFNLAPTYVDAFPFNSNNTNEVIGNTEEDIFAMQVTNSQGTNSFNTYFSPLGRGDIDISTSFINEFEPNDDRLSIYYDDGSIRTGKFDMVYSAVHIIRLAEMYLTRAEANFRLGTAVGDAPVNDINTIRDRVNLSSYAAGDLTLALILKERKLELAFEGFTLGDIKRTQGSVGPLAWNSPKLVFPIPDRERKVNSNLTQNEGY